MMSAAASTGRLPAPVPIGGTVSRANSHSWARCRAESHARATPVVVTGSVSSVSDDRAVVAVDAAQGDNRIIRNAEAEIEVG